MQAAALRILRACPLQGYAYGLQAPSAVCWIQLDGRESDWRVPVARSRRLLQSHLPPLQEPEGGKIPAVLAYLAALTGSLQAAAGMPDLGRAHIVALVRPAAAPGSGQQWRIALPTLVPTVALTALQRCTGWLSALAARPDADITRKRLGELKEAIVQIARHAPSGTNNRLFLQAARELGIPCAAMPGGVYQYGWGCNSRWLDSSFTEATSTIASKMARNKAVTSALLRQAGLPVPDHALVETLADAKRVAGMFGFPLVIKPASRDGGVGVSAGLQTEDELERAFARAQKCKDRILVEKHVPGRDYRVYVFRGRAIWAMERVPAGVVGDGVRTVGELMEVVNRDPRRVNAPWASMVPLTLNDEASELLAAAGLAVEAVPAAGQFVSLRRASNVSSGGTPMAAFQQMHPDNAALCVQAVQVLRLDLGGVDLLIPDIARSWRETGAHICEVNAQPQLSGATAPWMYGQVLGEMIPRDGRIPVVMLLTTESDTKLLDAVTKRTSGRLRLAITSSAGLQHGGQFVRAGRVSAYRDVCGLLADSSTEAVLIVTDGREFLRTGLPVDNVDLLLVARWSPLQVAGKSQLREVLSLLQPHCPNEVVVEAGSVAHASVAAAMGARRVKSARSAVLADLVMNTVCGTRPEKVCAPSRLPASVASGR